jgi:hypothetical protein
MTIKKIVWFIFLTLTLAAISQATVRSFVMMNAPQLEIFYDIKNEVWGGGSHWATSLRILEGKGGYVWSNRLLAPYVVLAISKIGVSYKIAAIIFYWCGLFAINFILFFLVKKLTAKVSIALAWVVFFNFMFVIFQDRSSWGWFYTFDILTIIFFTIFSYLVVNKNSIYSIVLLFIVALTNREDAMFMAVFIAISAVHFEAKKPFIKLQDLAKFALGLALMTTAVLYTKYVREYMSLIPPEHFGFAAGNSVVSIKTAFYNLFIRNFSFDNDPFFFNAPDGFWLIGSTVTVGAIFNKVSRPRKDLILIYILMVLSIMIFGNQGANEVRLYMPLFPMFIFIMLGLHLDKN